MKLSLYKHVVLFFLLCCCVQIMLSADLIIFSKDRPMQLDLFLRSLFCNVQGIDSIHVLFHAKNDEFDSAYAQVAQRFENVIFVSQNRENPSADFKTQLIRILAAGASEYITFAVDDMVLIRPLDVTACERKLEQTGAYCFHARLGKNVVYSYTYNKQLNVPPLQEVGDGFFMWNLRKGQSYWCRPHTTDMALYRRTDVISLLTAMNYRNPNELDGGWEMIPPRRYDALCCEHSCVINIPLNRVQNVWLNNRHMHNYGIEMLLALWNAGLMIDLHGVGDNDFNSAHCEIVPQFVSRN